MATGTTAGTAETGWAAQFGEWERRAAGLPKPAVIALVVIVSRASARDSSSPGDATTQPAPVTASESELAEAKQRQQQNQSPLLLIEQSVQLAGKALEIDPSYIYALNTITGEFGADDLLGVIFSQFCIGK